MSNPFRRTVASAAAVGIAGAGAVFVASPAQSVPADTACPAPYEGELTKGLPVDGLTVSSGNETEIFTGEVLGVLSDGIAPGLDMILVRLTSDEIDRVGGIWAGMSGSPVYAPDGSLIGAVSYGLAWGSSPVAGVTPAAAMQELLSRAPEASIEAANKVRLPARMKGRIVTSGAATTAEADSGMERLPMPVAVSGMYNTARLNKAAEKLGLENVKLYRSGAAPSAAADVGDIFSGSNLAASLSYGDFSAVGTGTTTMVCDDKVVGFGHPFAFAGETSLTLHAADAIYVQEDPLGFPFKVSNALGPVGVIDQDRLAGIKGLLGLESVPPTAAVTTTVNVPGRTRTGTSWVSVPSFGANVAAFGLLANQDRTFDKIGGGSALVSFTIAGTAGGTPFTLVRTNRYANDFDISFDTIWEPGDSVWALTQNDLVEVDIDSVDITSTMSSKARMFRIGKVQLRKKGVWNTLESDSRIKARPGRKLNFKLTLRSRRDQFGSKEVLASVRVPLDSTPGTFGAVSLGQVLGDCPDCDFEDEEGPETFQELVDSIEDAPRNDELTALVELFDEFTGELKSAQTKTLVGDVITNGKFFELKIIQ